jgi:hypothetical protein
MRPTTFNSTFPTFTAAILRALIDADVKNTPDGYAPTIDWDVFVDGNNWEISNVRITLVSRSRNARESPGVLR